MSQTSTVFACGLRSTAARISALGFSATTWKDLTPAVTKDRNVTFLFDVEDSAESLLALSYARWLTANNAAESVRLCLGDNGGLLSLPLKEIATETDDGVVRAKITQILRQPVEWSNRDRLLDMGIDNYAGTPPVQKWVAGRLLPAGVPVLLAGRGGIGKTTAALHLALLIAGRKEHEPAPIWMGQQVQTSGVSVVITYEEPTDSVHRSIHRLSKASNLDPKVIANRFVVKSMQDRKASGQALVARNPKTRLLDATPEYHALTDELRELRDTVGPIACIVIDNVGTAYDINGNDYTETNQAIKWSQRWSSEFGALVLNIGHMNKTNGHGAGNRKGPPTGDDILNGIMGSSGMTSSHRATLVMHTMTEEEEQFIAKATNDHNYEPTRKRHRYIKAQILKQNVEGIYEGSLTLRRDGVGMTDITDMIHHARTCNEKDLIEILVRDLQRLAADENFLQKTGKSGLYLNREVLSLSLGSLKRERLEAIANEALSLGIIEKTSRGLEVVKQ